MPFLQLFMETAQHYLATSGMTLSFPSKREHCQRLLLHVTICPVNVIIGVTTLIHVDRWVCTCKNPRGRGQTRPLSEIDFAAFQSCWVTAIFTAVLQPGVLGTSQMFWVCLCRRKDLWEKGSTRKQFSFPWFLSISVHWYHVCDCCARLFYIRGCRLYFNILFNLAFWFLSSPLFCCQITDLCNLCCRDKLWPPWKFHHLREGKR